jgi:hypothetical protein
MRIKIGPRGGAGFRILFTASMLLVMSIPLYAQSGIVPSELETLGDQILAAFTGDLARIILGCCFAGSCIAYAYNKDNEKMKGKILAVMVACALLAIGSGVIETLMGI